MKKTAMPFLAVLCLLSVAAHAQEAPAPRKMPRTPVSAELLEQQQHDALPASHQVQGLAAIIDGEKLRVGVTDMRLFGIVPPQLAASFGPQARAALDALAGGQNVTCQIRDRDRDGRLLATCHNAKDYDMAYELLKHGLAVTARGSLAGTELAAPYLAAEQAAQMQKIGLWSVPFDAAAANIPVAAVKAEAAAEPVPRAETAASIATQTSENQQKIAADLMAAQGGQARLDDAAWTPSPSTGFFERYQLLISVILMLLTAAGIMGALWMQKQRDRFDEIRAIAAALRGELMAARSVCAGRMKSITTDEEEAAASWPRIRSTLYQAYVGRLGLLGAELARQISSVYGQSSDYAGLYGQSGATGSTTKKQALESLVKNMDAILPRLSRIEHAGMQVHTPAYAPALRPEAPTYRATQQIPASPMPAHVSQNGETAVAADSPPTSTPANQETMMPQQQQPQAEAPSPALWEAVRGFINTTRNAIAAPTASQTDDQHVSEYTEMIEADMMRYRYDSSTENLDISPQKKQG